MTEESVKGSLLTAADCILTTISEAIIDNCNVRDGQLLYRPIVIINYNIDIFEF